MNPVDVHAARVTTGLTNLDAGGFEVAVTSAGEGGPSVAWNGNEWLIVWHAGDEVCGRRIARDGSLVDGHANDPGVLVAAQAHYPDIAWANGYTIAWTERSTRLVRTARFADLGAPLTGITVLGQTEFFQTHSAWLVPIGPRSILAAYARVAHEREIGGVMRAFLTTLLTPSDVPRRRNARH
jgi:hypothetical protein